MLRWLRRLQERIEEVIGQLQPLQITTILWSYAQLKRHPGIELMEALLAPLSLNIGQADPEVGVSRTRCVRSGGLTPDLPYGDLGIFPGGGREKVVHQLRKNRHTGGAPLPISLKWLEYFHKEMWVL